MWQLGVRIVGCSLQIFEGLLFRFPSGALFFLSSDLQSLIQRISERLIDAASGGLKRRRTGRLRQSKSLDSSGFGASNSYFIGRPF
jgi:hypothetical protein